MEVILRRHAMTAGNSKKQYIGSTDQPLSPEGEQSARLCTGAGDETVSKVYSSPMRRCLLTSRIFYPKARVEICPLLREMDFGLFEEKNYEDLGADPLYQQWLDSNCKDPCPEGESMEEFAKRVCQGFEEVMDKAFSQGETQVVILAHGGTLMALMGRYALPQRGYFQWQTPNCGGYKARWDEKSRHLVDWSPLTLEERK